MTYNVIRVSVHLLSFLLSAYALSGVKFDKFCDVKQPIKAQLLLLLSSLGLGFLVAQFFLSIAYF